MYILLTDETNKEPSKDGKFFVYGGLFFPIEKLSILHNEIEQIRISAGYKSGDTFKFDTNTRPEYVDIESATEAKRRVIDLCLRLECKFIAHIILHDIIRKQDFSEQMQKAADYVIGRYNRYLDENDFDGICVVDNLPDGTEFGYLATKFIKGLTVPGGYQVALNRIKLFASTRIGASHANSAMDIVLGSFRYAINNPKNRDAASTMLKNVSQMMWSVTENGVRYVRNRGLIIRPMLEEIRVKKYKQEYDKLMEHLEEIGN